MVRARVAEHSCVSIPFGAAHRVNFDTPPLKGLRLEPFRFQLETCTNNGAFAKNAILAVPMGTGTLDAHWRSTDVYRHA
jgi:hypothetical protein